jgi:hypothetical protein
MRADPLVPGGALTPWPPLPFCGRGGSSFPGGGGVAEGPSPPGPLSRFAGEGEFFSGRWRCRGGALTPWFPEGPSPPLPICGRGGSSFPGGVAEGSDPLVPGGALTRQTYRIQTPVSRQRERGPGRVRALSPRWESGLRITAAAGRSRTGLRTTPPADTYRYAAGGGVRTSCRRWRGRTSPRPCGQCNPPGARPPGPQPAGPPARGRR